MPVSGSWMYAWIVRRIAARALSRLSAGNPDVMTSLIAGEAHFRFPGRHPFATETRSKDEINRWLRRFAHFRPQFEIHDVIAAGWPWDIRASVHFTDRIGDPEDTNPYVNEGVSLIRLRWGRLAQEHVFLDTQAVADFFGTETADEFFGAVEP